MAQHILSQVRTLISSLETYASANNKDLQTMYKNLAMYLDVKVTRWLVDQPSAVLTDMDSNALLIKQNTKKKTQKISSYKCTVFVKNAI